MAFYLDQSISGLDRRRPIGSGHRKQVAGHVACRKSLRKFNDLPIDGQGLGTDIPADQAFFAGSDCPLIGLCGFLPDELRLSETNWSENRICRRDNARAF